MRNLIDSSIEWEKIGSHDKSQYKYEITEAVISKETGVLSITLRLNFIMPNSDMHKIAGIIAHQFGDLEDVKFKFIYEDVLLTEEEIISLFIPHMIDIINGDYIVWTQSILKNKYTFDGKNLIINTLGNFATKQLNKKVAVLFRDLLKSYFNMNVNVSFINDEENYAIANEKWHKTEEQDIQK